MGILMNKKAIAAFAAFLLTMTICAACGKNGATSPYGKDPEDCYIRVAPSLPPVDELEQAMQIFCLALKMAALEKAGKA